MGREKGQNGENKEGTGKLGASFLLRERRRSRWKLWRSLITWPHVRHGLSIVGDVRVGGPGSTASPAIESPSLNGRIIHYVCVRRKRGTSSIRHQTQDFLPLLRPRAGAMALPLWDYVVLVLEFLLEFGCQFSRIKRESLLGRIEKNRILVEMIEMIRYQNWPFARAFRVMMTMPQSDADCFFSLSRIRRRRIKTLDSQLRTCQMGSMGRSRCDNSRSLHCLPLSVAGCALFGDCPKRIRLRTACRRIDRNSICCLYLQALMST